MPRSPRLADVAKRAGVSSTTVSRFLNGTIELPERTRAGIEAAIRDLDYAPNSHARRLSRGQSDVVGLVVPDIATPFYARLAAAIEAEADRRGVVLALHATLNRAGREEDYLAAIRRNQVDGVIFATNHPDDGRLARLIDRTRRVVLLDEDVPGADAPRLFADNETGGYLVGRHLASMGHREVLVVGGPDAMLSGALRHAGVLRGLREVWKGGSRVTRHEGGYTVEAGREAARRFLVQDRPATAIFACSDELAIGVLEGLAEAGLRVPRDVSLVAFDDVGPLHLFDPPVTAVRQPVEELGQRALSLLLDTDWDASVLPGEEILPVSLIERGSVAPPVGATAATVHKEDT